jgi:hypothetical protein
VYREGLAQCPARVLATEEEEFNDEYREAHELEAQRAQRVYALHGMLREVHHGPGGTVDGGDVYSIAGRRVIPL